MKESNKDMIIGYISNYDWPQIECWVNSIEACGFEGTKVAIVGNATFQLVAKLKERGFKIVAKNRDEKLQMYKSDGRYLPVVERFYMAWAFFNDYPEMVKDHRFVIFTDTKDVVFQTNPSTFLTIKKKNMSYYLYVGSEGMVYKNEDWGKENMWNSFPVTKLYNKMENNTIYNCGTIAGYAEAMKSLFLELFLLSNNNPCPNPDQAALNVLIHEGVWSFVTNKMGVWERWSSNCGTTMKPEYQGSLLEGLGILSDNFPKIHWEIDMLCYNNDPFCIVHQYDRIPWLNENIQKKYRNYRGKTIDAIIE